MLRSIKIRYPTGNKRKQKQKTYEMGRVVCELIVTQICTASRKNKFNMILEIQGKI
jgi:hypothetical protein